MKRASSWSPDTLPGAWHSHRSERDKSLDYARPQARRLSGAALFEALAAFRGIPDSEEWRFILEMILYVVNCDI
jgi:hypothetical protein